MLGIAIVCGMIFLLISSGILLYQLWKGPSSADRALALYILGLIAIAYVLLIGLSAEINILINIAIAWSVLCFIGMIAISRYLGGKMFNE